MNENGEVTGLVKRKSRYVGKNISTKAVATDEREDVTSEYKYTEGKYKLDTVTRRKQLTYFFEYFSEQRPIAKAIRAPCQ